MVGRSCRRPVPGLSSSSTSTGAGIALSPTSPTHLDLLGLVKVLFSLPCCNKYIVIQPALVSQMSAAGPDIKCSVERHTSGAGIATAETSSPSRTKPNSSNGDYKGFVAGVASGVTKLAVGHP